VSHIFLFAVINGFVADKVLANFAAMAALLGKFGLTLEIRTNDGAISAKLHSLTRKLQATTFDKVRTAF
jgi:hypothetical protein